MTVHPDGQLLPPRFIVEFVPRADGQINVPLEATLASQTLVALVLPQVVNATSTEDSKVQPKKMPK